MPIREHTLSFTNYMAPSAPPKPDPTLGETFGAGFRLENDVLNAWELMHAPTFAKNPLYPLSTKLKDSGYWDDYRTDFMGVQSDEEFSYIAGKIERERKDRETLERAGWAGTVAAIAGGIMSPTVLLPLLGTERGAAAIVGAAARGFGAAALQEAPLVANQPSRTPQEVAISLTASTVLSGILGGAVTVLTKGEREAIEQSMVASGYEKTIPLSSVGSTVTRPPDAGKLASGAQTMANVLDSNAVTRSPVTDNIMGISAEARWTTAQLSDAGLAMERNAAGIPTTPGGTAENIITTHYGKYNTFAEALDDFYARYVFDEAPPSFAQNLRATVAGYTDADKLSRSEFRQEISKAIWNNFEHENKFVVEAAKMAQKEIYDPILKELQGVGLLGEQLKLLADPAYLNRVFNHDAIRADVNGFVDFLSERMNRKLQEEFAKKLENFQLAQAKRTQTIEDVERPQDQIDALREQFDKQLAALDERANAEQFNALEDSIMMLRSAARKLTGQGTEEIAQRKQLLADAREMERMAGPKYADIKTERAEIKRRLSNLNKAKVVLEERLAKKLDKVDRAEDLSMATLNRAAKAGYKFLTEMEKWTDEKLGEELSKLKNQFERTAQIYDKGEERIVALAKSEDATDAQLLAADALQQGRADRMTEVAERIADAEDLGRGAMRELINDMLQEALAKIQKINSRRAVRTERLRAQAKNLDPALAEQRVQGLRAKIGEKERDFAERVRVAGGDSFDLRAGKADFSAEARKAANQVKNKILGTYLRLPTVDIMQGERAAVLTRVLDIPSNDLAPWLEKDIDKLVRIHLRTMAPDIEIARKLGTVNGEEQFARMIDEMDEQLEAVKTAKGKDGKPLSPAAQKKEVLRIQEEYDQYKKNLEGIIGRLRHNYGLPSDPDGMGYRMAKTVMGLNVLRYMGGVVIASVPDVARPVMRFGVTRAFRDGFLPLITNLKGLKMSMREGRLAGVGIDALTHQRSYAVLDIMEDMGRRSKFEKGVEYASGRMGAIALFDYWTDAMKGITSAIANAKIMDTVMLAAEGKAAKGDFEYLAQLGMDAGMAERIVEEVRKGGGGRVDGVWLPNTETWTDDGALRAFRSAVVREVNNTIITPGVERPLWTNASTMGRMVSQFKSFAFASTTKTLMSGLQQRDMAFANGVVISLALGALSYYLYAVSKGGETYEKMLNAGPGEWADQMTQRSGILAVFGLGQDLLSRIPGVAKVASFSGERSTRRGGDDLISAALGPTFNAATTAADILTGVSDPTQSTLHKARTLTPFQNISYLSRIFDAIEDSIPVKETRR